ncbi:hypothetical protein ACFX5Q_33040 [Mesorhizobium sp. IMUNJ 23033]|uniref:hypothetical protein n=1 Tax=Mesorhizobium sp. IMUNJ 23033 TaxID=3378039 RepID=UPI00384DFEEE
MGHFLKSLAGSFLGKLLAGLVIAVLILLGFGPNAWAAWLMSHSWAQLSLIAIAAFLAGLLAVNIYLQWPRAARLAKPRRLSPAQKNVLADSLKSRNFRPNDVAVRFAAGNDECREYAEDFADVLRRLGWTDHSGTSIDEDPHLTKLRLVIDSQDAHPQNAAMMADAFRDAGVSFEWGQMDGPLGTPTILYVYRNA